MDRQRRTQAERQEESRRRMLDAALALLAERKSLSFSLAEVAERAGYSRGLPTQTFGTKVELIRELISHIHVRSMEEVLSRPDQRGQGLGAVLTTVYQLFQAPEGQVQIMIAVHALLAEATLPGSPYRAEAAALNRWAVSYLSYNLRLGMAAGEVREDINPRAQAMVIIASVRGALLQWLVEPERIALEDLRDELVGALQRGLSPRPGSLAAPGWRPPAPGAAADGSAPLAAPLDSAQSPWGAATSSG